MASPPARAAATDSTAATQIDGTSLLFSEEMAVTLSLCDEDLQSVEDAYLAALGQVDGWIIDDGALELSDDFGDVILTFEVPDIMLTAEPAERPHADARSPAVGR